MKKTVLLLLSAIFLLSFAAYADASIGDQLMVANCNEFITLREEPDTSSRALAQIGLGELVNLVGGADDDFLMVEYMGQTGYVLARYVEVFDDFSGEAVSLTRDQRYNVNLFLSNFSEIGFMLNSCFSKDTYTDDVLVDFAIEHIWFNRQDKLEWGQWGEYNVRLSDEYINPDVRKYFGVTTENLHQTRFHYKNGYYYWTETGGHINFGHACLDYVEDLGRGFYSVYFSILDVGEYWENDVCYDTLSDAILESDADRFCRGHAMIYVGEGGSLNDRSTWELMRYTVRWW